MAYKRADQRIQMNESAIREALTALKQPGDVFEIRILAGKGYTMSAYFDDVETAIATMKTTPVWKKSNVYFTINRILPECFSREQHNCFVENVPTTNDPDISDFVLLMIDLDPERRTGISSTEEERGHARDVARKILAITRDLNWPEPIQAMSGNGYHLLFQLEPLPNTQENADLISKVLQTFNQECGNDKCHVDTTNYNPSRICKLYGTLAQKGSNTDDRPHRMSKLINVPDVRGKVSSEQLEAFTKRWKAPEQDSKGKSKPAKQTASAGAQKQDPDAPRKSCRKYGIKDLGAYLDGLGITHAEPEAYKTGRKYVLDKCVFDESHQSPDAAVFQFPDGVLTYRCLHNSCKGKNFAQFIQKVDPDRYLSAQKTEKEPITIEALEDEYEECGIGLRLNMITHEIEVVAEDDLDYPSLITTMHSFLKGNKPNYTGVTFETLSAYSEEIAKKSKYNPVLEYLAGIEYDGQDHLGELFDLMGIDDEDKLSRILIRKWFLQGIALLHNTENHPISPEGVLTLQGPQRCGKTSLIEHFAIRPEWFARGAALNPNDKDTIRRCCSRWIIELGEVETTLRSDIEALKNFITNDVDVYRVPYGRSDLKYARRSNLAATCNSDRYLLDQTGNRRWWTVPISKYIRYDDIQAFPIVQLWVQAFQEYREHGPNCFRLTAAEHDDLNERNSNALKPVKAEEEVADVLRAAELMPWKYRWVQITVTEWKDHFDSLRKYEAVTVGKALSKLKIDQRSSGSDRLRTLPILAIASSGYHDGMKIVPNHCTG